jgi:uncharacterized protein
MNQATHPEPGKGFEFPGTFEVTAMGDAIPELEAIVLAALTAAGVTPDLGSVRHRNSSGGKYVAVAVSFPCDTRERYMDVHKRLRANPVIRWTL